MVQSGLIVEFLSCCFRTVSVAKRSVAVGLVSEPEICHGCRSFIASSARIRVQLAFLSCLGSRMLFAKTVTSNLPLLSVLALDYFLNLYRVVLLSPDFSKILSSTANFRSRLAVEDEISSNCLI